MMTKEQMLEKYGEVEVSFDSYYKYTFYFTGEHEGKTIDVSVGGDSDDIYKFNVSRNAKYKIKDLPTIVYLDVTEGKNFIESYSYY